MRAFILGCSHAAGSEMWHEPGFPIADVVVRESYGFLHSYPAKIATALGYEIHNHAIPGGSNDAMYRIFCSLNFDSTDIVIACWTGAHRTEVWCETAMQWISICGGAANTHQKVPHSVMREGNNRGNHVKSKTELENYAKQWMVFQNNPDQACLNRYKNMIALNFQASIKKIPVINFDSFNQQDRCGQMMWPMDIDFCTWCTQQGFPKSQMGHFFEHAHMAYAESALKNIDNKFLNQYNNI